MDIKDPQGFRDEQKKICASLGMKGRMLISEEGINATFEGTKENIEIYKKLLKTNPLFNDLAFKESAGTGSAFTKLEIKVRKEIVTLGAGRFDIKNETAAEITADELEELYNKDEDFVVLDLRNDFEVDVGYFDKTIDPELRNFRDLPEKLSSLGYLKDRKVVAVCTGGIRCEKATCLMKKEGFKNLYQLKDGIHTYMQKYPGRHFKGSLFVFDNRLTTPVVETPNREIVGQCYYCQDKCEVFYSNDSTTPSIKMICCDKCAQTHSSELRRCTP